MAFIIDKATLAAALPYPKVALNFLNTFHKAVLDRQVGLTGLNTFDIQSHAEGLTLCYSMAFPSLDFNNRASSKACGEILGALWVYCIENDLPAFNFNIVEKGGANLPAKGVEDWYQDTFKSLLGYPYYCRKQAELASYMFVMGEIVFV